MIDAHWKIEVTGSERLRSIPFCTCVSEIEDGRCFLSSFPNFPSSNFYGSHTKNSGMDQMAGGKKEILVCRNIRDSDREQRPIRSVSSTIFQRE